MIVAEGPISVIVLKPPCSASMGPQLDSCGRLWLYRCMLRQETLQWGRNLIVAEGYVHGADAKIYRQLQWGRNLIVAEG